MSPSALVGAWTEGPRRFAGLGLLCLSCTSGQIGGEVIEYEPSSETLGACELTRQVPIEPDDADLPLDLEALIEIVEGSSTVEALEWGARLPEGASLTPEPGQHSIEVGIVYVEGSARRLELEVPEAGGPEPAIAGASGDSDEAACAPLLAFEAEVTVSTDSGAIDDSFVALFIVRSAHLVTATFDIEPGKFEGELDLDLNGDGGGFFGASVYLGAADGRLSGIILATDVAAAFEESGSVQVGRFPSGGCEDGYDLASDSTLASGAQAAVSTLTEFELTWPDGAVTDLSMIHELGPACLVSWGSSTNPSVVLPMTSSVLTGDGGIDGEWSLAGTVTFDEAGEVTWTDVARADFAVAAAGEFALSTGITGLEVDPEMPATFSFQLSDQHGDELPASGTLTVLESHPAACDPPPEEPTDGGGVAPGCSGDELVEIGTASLTQSN